MGRAISEGDLGRTSCCRVSGNSQKLSGGRVGADGPRGGTGAERQLLSGPHVATETENVQRSQQYNLASSFQRGRASKVAGRHQKLLQRCHSVNEFIQPLVKHLDEIPCSVSGRTSTNISFVVDAIPGSSQMRR